MVWLQVGKNPKIETKRKITYNAVLGEERFKCWGTLPNSDVQLLSFHKRCCAFDWQQNLAWPFFSIAVVLRMPQALLAELWLCYCSRPCFFLGLCFGMCWDSAWKQFEHRVFENCLLRFLGPSIRAESCRQLVAQSAGASGLNRIQMPSCFHSFKQMCFPVGLHKGFVSSFVGEW